ncbi:regulatory protein RecX [Cellulosilyticum ruminicola]|uniref:hypothetical protein n=1 Tax=Cellulosilyticum ruminicola TaxID=425254 RepID=UPI0006D0A1EF|nr:hypothetical protein [Cellulosilyticum ruminicola]
MKTITKISVQQGGERYSLFLDEEFYCGVSEDTLIKLNLKKGMQLDETTLELLNNEEVKISAFLMPFIYWVDAIILRKRSKIN